MNQKVKIYKYLTELFPDHDSFCSAGKDNPAYKTTETDFTDDIKGEKKQELDVEPRSRANTTASQVTKFHY